MARSRALPSTATADVDEMFMRGEEDRRTGPQLFTIETPTPALPPMQFTEEEFKRLTPMPTF